MKHSTTRVLRLLVLTVSTAVRTTAQEAHAERIDSTHVTVSWPTGHPSDIYASVEPDGDVRAARVLARGDVSGAFLAIAPVAPRPYFTIVDATTHTATKVAERVLPLQRGSNFRDLGGYPAAGHKHVRWGLIFRSAATPRLTDEDFSYLRRLSMKADVDLRSTDERAVFPDALPMRTGVRYIAIDYRFADLGDGYPTLLTDLTPQFRAIFTELLKHGGGLTFHCTAGQDRTGVAAALVLSALGVPRNVIVEDYLLSVRYRRPRMEFWKLDSAAYPGNAFVKSIAAVPEKDLFGSPDLYDAHHVPFLDQAFDEINHRWGDVLNYLNQVLGVGPAEIARLREIYLE